jgi:hypothetical protein
VKDLMRSRVKQYKTQLKRWGLDKKNIKASEYRAMLKKKRNRELEDPPKETRFIIRGRQVDPKAITRFAKRIKVIEHGMMYEDCLDPGIVTRYPNSDLSTNFVFGS